jgi:hypothetical protein
LRPPPQAWGRGFCPRPISPHWPGGPGQRPHPPARAFRGAPARGHLAGPLQTQPDQDASGPPPRGVHCLGRRHLSPVGGERIEARRAGGRPGGGGLPRLLAGLGFRRGGAHRLPHWRVPVGKRDAPPHGPQGQGPGPQPGSRFGGGGGGAIRESPSGRAPRGARGLGRGCWWRTASTSSASSPARC